MIEIAASLIDSFICIWFITSFLQFKKKKLIFALVAIPVYFLVTLICDEYLSGFNVLASFVLLVPVLIYSFLICERHFIKAVIACSIYKIVIIIISSLLFTIISSLIDDFGVLMQGSNATVRIIYLALHKVIIISVFSAVLTIFKNSTINDLVTGIIVFGTSVVTIVGLGSAMVIIAKSNIQFSHISSILLVSSFLLINIGVYSFVNRVKKLEKQKYDLLIIKDRYEFQNKKYQDAINIWTRIKQIQHDIKNHLVIIKERLDSNQYEDCKKYVESLIPKTTKIGNVIHTGNDILDYLVNTKLSVMDNANISVSGVLTDLSSLPETDLVSIFGNIVDNIAEAIEPSNERKVEFLFAKEEENQIMIFKNSISSSVLTNNHELKSTKKDKESHGIGHVIVEEIVNKLGGIINYSEADGMFSVQIVFPIKK